MTEDEAPATGRDWVVVVPVKAADRGKSRLVGHVPAHVHADLVRAMALDTVAAVAASPAVARVVVVTPDAEVAKELAGWVRDGAAVEVAPEPEHVGTGGVAALREAVAAGVGRVPAGSPVAVLLGDLPALRTPDLTDALRLAAAYDRALVPDADGTGTTLLTAQSADLLEPRFGPGSAAAHRALGCIDLPVAEDSSLRRDVDEPADLDRAVELGVGHRTAAVLAASAARATGRGWSTAIGWVALLLAVACTLSAGLATWYLVDSLRQPESFGALAAYAIFLPAAVVTGVPAFVIARVQARRRTAPRWRTLTTTVLAVPGLLALVALVVVQARLAG